MTVDVTTVEPLRPDWVYDTESRSLTVNAAALASSSPAAESSRTRETTTRLSAAGAARTPSREQHWHGGQSPDADSRRLCSGWGVAASAAAARPSSERRTARRTSGGVGWTSSRPCGSSTTRSG